MSTSTASTERPAPPAGPLQVTDRTRATRLGHRQVTDRAALHDVLDSALVAHVAMVREAPGPTAVVLPIASARDGESLLLHGSTGGGMLRAAAAGQTVTAR